jgi:hypothetical protein
MRIGTRQVSAAEDGRLEDQQGVADHAPIWFTLMKVAGDHGPAERATLLPND